ncbi:unnamed protein product [Ostreobium quekettii]|uniref:Uncharacterized protein n=1 Tax=Ostreobium quekettii TaxID=121088 RepID=A0A8S1J1H9_9CHLO|nr:unnamed protein product [Ostreobium quekettii]
MAADGVATAPRLGWAQPGARSHHPPLGAVRDGPLRAHVASQVLLLLQLKGHGGRDGELSGLVARLEEALYRTARSLEEYADGRTLEGRLRRVAEALLRRARRAEAKSGGESDGSGSELLGGPVVE